MDGKVEFVNTHAHHTGENRRIVGDERGFGGSSRAAKFEHRGQQIGDLAADGGKNIEILADRIGHVGHRPAGQMGSQI